MSLQDHCIDEFQLDKQKEGDTTHKLHSSPDA